MSVASEGGQDMGHNRIVTQPSDERQDILSLASRRRRIVAGDNSNVQTPHRDGFRDAHRGVLNTFSTVGEIASHRRENRTRKRGS